MDEIQRIVHESNIYFRNVLSVKNVGGLSREQYIRYLQMQYHLTNGVQRPFMFIASHESSRPYKQLRKFLVQFAYEEEMHFKLAEKDLIKLNADVGEMPLDVSIWWAFYNQVMPTTPLIRLGATCILENVGNGTSDVLKELMKSAPYLTPENATFLKLHMHEELPHGEQILQALAAEEFSAEDYGDIVKGCEIGFVLYARMVKWVLSGAVWINTIQ